jgi:hypothetical protein
MKPATTTQAGRTISRAADESGVALITAVLAVMLMSALMAGMFAALSADQQSHALDRDQTQAYAAAQAGLEKLTSGLATLFATDVSPSVAQINAVATTPPAIPGFAYTAPGGGAGSGYAVTFTPDAHGDPIATTTDITTGPFTGFKGIITPYQITVTAASAGGAEVRLRREIQTVAVPVFQFGVFSDSDLTFYAGDDFSFGGRVHTNKSLFLCEFAGTMTFTDRMTAVGDVIHNYFSNGLAASTYGCSGPVLIPTSASTNRNLKQSPNEGSVVGMPGSAKNPNWPTISTGNTYYKSWIRNGQTGAKKLDLPLVSQGASPIDLIRRPAVNSNENVVNAPVYQQRYFSQASVRILLSDRASDITGLPTVTGTAPVALSGNWLAGGAPGGYSVGANRPPVALSAGPVAATVSNNATGTTIKVTSIPAGFMSPTLDVGGQSVQCKGKTPSSFTGCTKVPSGNIANIPANTTIRATLPSAWVASTVAPNAITGGASIVITTANNGALAFSPLTFWIDGVLWQCTGYDTATTPDQFTGCTNAEGVGIGAVTSGKTVTTSALSDPGQPLIGGYIKIETQSAAGAWSDVTAELLSLGFGDRNQEGNICNDPTPDAVIRIQRLRDNGSTATACAYNNSTNPVDWWPNTLYDTREGTFRDVSTSSGDMSLGGVMQYVSLDVNNLKRWLAGSIGSTGAGALNNNGYIVYFSDRRGDHDENRSDIETGEYAFEDQVNPNSSAGTHDGVLQTGEDMNGNGVQDRWGETPSTVANVIPTGSADPYSSNGRPWSTILNQDAGRARVNKVVLFRRALKLVNGGQNNLPASGLTVASENPVYVQGNYNATSGLATGEAHVPASVIADAVTLLSNGWTDVKSLVSPNSATSRDATTTGYRMGVVAGKGLSFPHCGGNCGGAVDFLFGTDGGAGNFLRLLEDWRGPGASVNYRGSLISLYISTQATGTFKYNANVYDYADRKFSFDTDFLTPQLLPPGTPMFRDINTLKFRQILRPNQ